MYVTHRESEHGDWEERKRRQKRDKTSSSREGASDTSTSTRKEQVKVNDNLKHALATRGFSQDQIAAIMEESGSSDFVIWFGCFCWNQILPRVATLQEDVSEEIIAWSIYIYQSVMNTFVLRTTSKTVYNSLFMAAYLVNLEMDHRVLALQRNPTFRGAYHSRLMILSSPMLSAWFCAMHGWFSVMDLAAAIADRNCYHHYRIVMDVVKEWFPEPPRKPPDGYIAGTVSVLILFVFQSICLWYSIWKIFCVVREEQKGEECQGKAKTKDSKEKKSERTMECFVTSFRIPSIVTDAFSSENEGETREPKSVSFDPDGTSVIMDNSANCHIFRDKALFKDGIKSFPVTIQHLKVRTANGSTAPAGIGTVEITIRDDEGKNHKLKLENALYFPESPVNVLGVTALAEQLDDDDGTYIKTFRKNSIFVCDNESWERSFEHPPSGLPELSVNEGFSTLTALYEAFASVIPMAKATMHCFASEQQLHPSEDIGVIQRTAEQFCQEVGEEDVEGREEINSFMNAEPLTSLEEEFMMWHCRLSHLPYKYMLRLSALGILPRKFLKLKDPPKCAGCQFAKAHRKAWRTKGEEGGSIRKDNEVNPGDAVSTDQLHSAQEGLVPQVTGKLTSDRITGATIFVDHATNFIYVHLMKCLSSEETIKAKCAADKRFAEHGHSIKRFRADNGRYADVDFMENLALCNQTISFCGVGAHHQNAIAERAIKELTLASRTMLLHAQRHWPEMISTMLWPLALKCAAEQINLLRIDKDGLSPAAKMSGITETNPEIILPKHFHTFGCPAYVLDPKAQSGSIGPPKWDLHAYLGIYVGHSPVHAGNVALILNVKTGHVSPQYHVVFDDEFKTVPHLRTGSEPDNWRELVNDNSELVTDEAYELATTWSINSERGSSDSNEVPSPAANDRGRSDSDTVSSSASSNKDDTAERGRTTIPSKMPAMINLRESGLRRSTRTKSTPGRLGFFTKFCLVASIATHLYQCDNPSSFATRTMKQFERINSTFNGEPNVSHPFCFANQSSDNEVYTFKEMLEQPDRIEFVEAMEKELDSMQHDHIWDVVSRDSMSGVKPILAIWSFKRKRFPDGTINKYKARLCAHGGMQQWGINYWETYAPVVNWISVRLLLTISIMYDLPTTAIDFVLAYPQAMLPEDTVIYMDIPMGTFIDGAYRKTHVLKLRKNLYGLKQAGLNWFNYLKQGLEERGFRQSNVDPCVFIHSDAIIITYVDDCIILSKEESTVNMIVESLQDGKDPDNPNQVYTSKYVLTNDGEVKNYLGVEVVKREDGSIELKQKFLIERIIEAVGLDKDLKGSSKPTPSVKPLLNKDLDGLERKHDWNYRSVVGMTGYLQSSTRPDLSMAVHQCARFNNNPKLSHERALSRIARYLIGTQDKGLIFKPDKNKGIECYVDASFADGWANSDSSDPENVLSRTGYVIYYAGCPIHWCSKLQTEHALSTCEAEYVALSQSMRDVIPLMNLITEFQEILDIPDSNPKVKCKVFEDNASCIKVAKAPSMTPRTKHIALKYHHFRSFVRNGSIDIEHIGTSEQTADLLTKPLSTELFLYLRKKLIGW